MIPLPPVDWSLSARCPACHWSGTLRETFAGSIAGGKLESQGHGFRCPRCLVKVQFFGGGRTLRQASKG